MTKNTLLYHGFASLLLTASLVGGVSHASPRPALALLSAVDVDAPCGETSRLPVVAGSVQTMLFVESIGGVDLSILQPGGQPFTAKETRRYTGEKVSQFFYALPPGPGGIYEVLATPLCEKGQEAMPVQAQVIDPSEALSYVGSVSPGSSGLRVFSLKGPSGARLTVLSNVGGRSVETRMEPDAKGVFVAQVPTNTDSAVIRIESNGQTRFVATRGGNGLAGLPPPLPPLYLVSVNGETRDGAPVLRFDIHATAERVSRAALRMTFEGGNGSYWSILHSVDLVSGPNRLNLDVPLSVFNQKHGCTLQMVGFQVEEELGRAWIPGVPLKSPISTCGP